VVALSSPTGLQAFQLRLGDEHGAFAATPSFAWKPVRSAARYQFELSTSKAFGAANGVVWSSRSLTAPIASVPIALPWMTKRPLYWGVRAFGGDRGSPGSKAARFQMKTASRPHRLPGGVGYIRWSPVSGATGYQVSFVNLKKVVGTTTTVADLRDYYRNNAP